MEVFEALKPKQIDQISQKSNSTRFYKKITHYKIRTPSLSKFKQNKLQTHYQEEYITNANVAEKKFCRQNIKNLQNIQLLPNNIKDMVSKGIYQETQSSQKRINSHRLFKDSSKNSLNEQQQCNQLEDQDNNITQQQHKQILELLEQYLPKKQNFKSAEEYIQNKKQTIKQLPLENYIKELLLVNDDHLTLEYLAHLLRICQCYKCECTLCKCAYAFNNENIKYPIQNRKKVQKEQQIDTNLNTKIDYETKPQKEQFINSQSLYQQNFTPHQSQSSFQDPKLKQTKFKYDFCYRSQYQMNFLGWNKQDKQNFKNLDQLKVQHEIQNNTQKSDYQDNFIQQQYQKQIRLPTEINQIQQSQPFEYTTLYRQNFKGEKNIKNVVYPQPHRIQDLIPQNNNYLSQNKEHFTKKDQQDLQCPGKTKINLKDEILNKLRQ